MDSVGSQNCFGIALDWTGFNLVKQLTGDQLTTTSSALAETLWMSPMVELWPTNVVTKQRTKFLCIVVAWEAIVQFPNCSLEPMQRRQTVMCKDIKINTNGSESWRGRKPHHEHDASLQTWPPPQFMGRLASLTFGPKTTLVIQHSTNKNGQILENFLSW